MSDDKNKESQKATYRLEHIEFDARRLDVAPDNDSLPILATRNLVLFPGVTVTFELGREISERTARYALEKGMPIGIVCQTEPDNDSPAVTTGLYRYGVYADVLNVFDPDKDTHVAIVRSRGRFRILGSGHGEHVPGGLTARVKAVDDVIPVAKEAEASFEACLQAIRATVDGALRVSGDPNNLRGAMPGSSDGVAMMNFLATNMPFEPSAKAAMLAMSALSQRADRLLSEVQLFKQRVDLTEEVASKARRNMDEAQRNAFLQQQMDAIRETLYGDEDDEVDKLIARAEECSMPEKVLETFRREAEKMRRFNPTTPDYSIQYTYLDILASLPWNVHTPVNKSLETASEILEADHYGLEKVKERILEQLALILHNPQGKSPIICLVGAPGVGKTSVGRSVARALGRKYERVSFGGLHDESEIRGHRRTYIGAMPGRIIDAMKRVGVTNPVILLDEIDKIGNDYKGDPAAALLEVLDPEQNCHFHDNYIDVDFDLSNVLFIATANTLSTIARPLLDRMEIIDISGYLLEEKIEIARRHLLPRIRANHRLTDEELVISDEALTAIIRDYTAESGVRALEKKLAAVARKAVLYGMQGKTFPHPVEPADLYDLLGLAPVLPENYEGNDIAGVVTGLAWTEVGGAILMAETSLSPAKEGRIAVTGNLGDVMKESASIAYQWVKAHADVLGISREKIDTTAVHVHFPEGAVPKDGPSAGITIVTSIVSAFKGKKVAARTAMTGEATLRGRVLPVGGIREKILAAKRAGITDIIMSEKNRRDIDDMPESYRRGLTFHYVDTLTEVVALAVTDEDANQ
ncbi:MAG: endopeptidase La [Muribaculaceae bacterium]|nr:endopeptidase La [Muribaculaceae bacterium]